MLIILLLGCTLAFLPQVWSVRFFVCVLICFDLVCAMHILMCFLIHHIIWFRCQFDMHVSLRLVSLNFIQCVQYITVCITLLACYEIKNKRKFYCIYAFSNKSWNLYCSVCYCRFNWIDFIDMEILLFRTSFSFHKQIFFMRFPLFRSQGNLMFMLSLDIIYDFGHMNVHSQDTRRYTIAVFVNAQFTFLKTKCGRNFIDDIWQDKAQRMKKKMLQIFYRGHH